MADLHIEAAGLRIAFSRQIDRFAHTILMQNGSGEWLPLLESIEGTPDHDWPPSPPFQELHFEDRPNGGRVALLVGRAGKSHWSASVEIDGVVRCATFDVACRAKEASTSIGSQYRLLPNVRAKTRFGDVLLNGSVRMIAVSSDGPATKVCTDGNVVATVASYPGDSWPQTMRWKYQFAIELSH
jgi:hypothetical protein